jgi:cytochrome c556
VSSIQQDAEMVKAARCKIKSRAKKLLKENQHTFQSLRVGDTVRVARATDGVWQRTRQLKQPVVL